VPHYLRRNLKNARHATWLIVAAASLSSCSCVYDLRKVVVVDESGKPLASPFEGVPARPELLAVTLRNSAKCDATRGILGQMSDLLIGKVHADSCSAGPCTGSWAVQDTPTCTFTQCGQLSYSATFTDPNMATAVDGHHYDGTAGCAACQQCNDTVCSNSGGNVGEQCQTQLDCYDSDWSVNYCLNGLCYHGSPIIIDVLGDGFSLTDAKDGVEFDFNGNGKKVKISWTTPRSDDAWLVLDRNGNGLIDSAKEMFGNITEQPHTEDPNGYLALAVFDRPAEGGNGDGVIDSRDRVFSRLRLWQDKNHDAVSQSDELFTLVDLGVESIDLHYQETKWVDRYENLFRFRSKVDDARHTHVGRWSYDVFLVTKK
jgi:hypothetical protein